MKQHLKNMKCKLGVQIIGLAYLCHKFDIPVGHSPALRTQGYIFIPEKRAARWQESDVSPSTCSGLTPKVLDRCRL